MTINCQCGHSFEVTPRTETRIEKGLRVTRTCTQSCECPSCGISNIYSPTSEEEVNKPEGSPQVKILLVAPAEMSKRLMNALRNSLAEGEPPSEKIPDPHPCCKAHGHSGDLAQECSCAQWWEAERADLEKIEDRACKECGDVECDGGEKCPERNLEVVIASRNAARDANLRLRDERFAVKKLLMEALRLPLSEIRSRKPKLVDLACGMLSVMDALRLQALVLAAEQGLPEGAPSEHWYVAGGVSWRRVLPGGGTVTLTRFGMMDWRWTSSPSGSGVQMSGKAISARASMVQIDLELAELPAASEEEGDDQCPS